MKPDKKKFHFCGEDDDGNVTLSECSDQEESAIVKLKKAKSEVPLKMGERMCQMSFDNTGHVELDALDIDGANNGPAMVSSDEYRRGWDRVFGSKTN